MLSLSRLISGGCTLALALALSGGEKPLAAQATAQHTTHKKRTMPMNMPMGKQTQEKKTKSKTSKVKKSGTVKKAPAGRKTSVLGASAKQKMDARMPMAGNAEHGARAEAGQMHMPDTAHTHTDTAQGRTGTMQMRAPPAKTDSMNVTPKPADSMRMAMPNMSRHSADDMMIGPVGISMERMGSGTTWIPDAVALPSRRRMFGNWMVMAHGFVFAQYDKQTGERGDDQFGSLNWTMLMATRDVAGGRLQARTMLNLDPAGVSKRGYPLLLQTGETYKGQPLHDRQHPHDFWMELGALYQREIKRNLAWSVYVAPSGEPALGPVAFMHRPSAMDNLTAPLTHHWQDATPASFGVATACLSARKRKLEGSVFNWRE